MCNSCLKVGRVDADANECGRVFQACAAATRNAWSPSVEQRVAGMISCNVDAERRCHRVITSDTRWSCWPGNHEPYCVGSDIPAHKACIQSSQGHATNEAARAAE